MGHVFISYSHKDTEYAHALAANLQGLGFEVWIDERLDYGAQWPQELQKQLDTCSAFILIMSPRSYESDWVQSELQRAKRKQKPIFPLLLEGDEPWLSVESTQYYDVRGEVFPDAKFYSALKAVMTPTPGARTLQMPKGSVRAGLAQLAQRRTWLALGGGLALLVCLVAGILFLRPRLQGAANSTEPAAQPSTAPGAAPVGKAGPEVTFTPHATGAAPISSSSAGEAEMVLVPAGTFTMGRDAADELAECLEKFHSECQLSWFRDEEPVHEVTLPDFYVDVYEVTNAAYQACEQQGGCEPPKSAISNTRLKYYGNPEFDNYPVIQVTWDQAKAYCEWRGARLPTEAEWEKAARGTDNRLYPWGDELDETRANYNWNVGDTTAVGSYESGKSPYGLYDMAGNVWEWTSTLHAPYPYDASDGRESPTSRDLRVMRGGGWGEEGGNSVSVSYRFGYEPDATNIDLGFRCASDTKP